MIKLKENGLVDEKIMFMGAYHLITDEMIKFKSENDKSDDINVYDNAYINKYGKKSHIFTIN